MKTAIILSLFLFILPAWVINLGKDKLIMFASLSYYGSDYDGDKRCDFSVWDSTTNTLYFQLSSDGKFYQKKFFDNSVSFEPVFADYDGDSKTDFVFFHKDSGQWIFNLSSQPDYSQKMFLGSLGDLPIPTDINGVGSYSPTIWRPNSSSWVITDRDEDGQKSNKTVLEGSFQDSAFAFDYDGDGKSDLAVWRPDDGFWHIVKSSTNFDFGQSEHIQHGQQWDVIVPHDYDGDGRDDLVFWRPQNQTWYLLYAGNKAQNQIKFGQKDDIPLSGDVDGDGIPELITWSQMKKSWNVLNFKKQESSSYKWDVPGSCVPAVSVLQKYD